MTAQEIVQALDRFVIGQDEAKRKVAIALRNRTRRQELEPNLRQEVTPKNILMIGPTGVGKTEIARRLARLVGAPFVKVEVTRFTEVGYVGRDVESVVRDLVEVSLRLVRDEMRRQIEPDVHVAAEERLVDLLLGDRAERPNPFASLFGFAGQQQQPERSAQEPEGERREKRRTVRERLRRGEMEDEMVEVDVEEQTPLPMADGQGQMQEMLQQMLPKRTRRRSMKVSDARAIVRAQEADRLIDPDKAAQEALRRAEQSGIIFLDEIDKVAARGAGHGPDVSREGVQRDLLPIVEGTTVQTKYGPIATDHILFIAAGAFHIASPQDLIPELQGRFPIRVELRSLGVEELRRILVEPEHALVQQYAALLATDGLELEVTADAVQAIAEFAHKLNDETEDIGARRLHTLLERCLEDALYRAPEAGFLHLTVDRAYVERQLGQLAANPELSRYIL